MKNILYCVVALLFYSNAYSAQTPTPIDSTTFEEQRQRVNTLLNDRSTKFGDYDLSLTQKTGIFGIFKTKNDMQKSIEILKEIVITDNNIFLETKKLLDLKDSESAKQQRLALEYDQQVTAYMKTVSKLQAENEILNKKIDALENQDHSNNLVLYLLVAVSLILAWFVYKFYSESRRRKNLTQV